MRIANPIYDVVFKYLMLEDLNIAKLVISSLIGKKVLELTPYPTELTANNEPVKNTKRDSFTVYRLDFAAKIKESDGAERLILIELQKAKFISDIMRFRRYLGKQYMKKEHYYLVNSNKVPLPIYPIYILGHKLDDFTEEAIYIKRSLYNAITNEKLKTQKNIFIDGLTHDGLIIQIPYVNKTLETKGKTKFNKRLKELITIFDQSFQEADSSEHFFDINRAIQSNSGYAYNSLSLNNTTTYKFWLESHLEYVYLKSIFNLIRKVTSTSRYRCIRVTTRNSVT